MLEQTGEDRLGLVISSNILVRDIIFYGKKLQECFERRIRFKISNKRKENV